MRIESGKPILISPIPSAVTTSVTRPVAVKRLGRLRLNWFLMGSVFGVAFSFLLDGAATQVVSPAYHAAANYIKSSYDSGTSKEKPNASAVSAASKPAAITPSVTAAAPAAPPAPVTAPSIQYPVTLALKVSRGDTLLDLLVAQRVQLSEAHEVINALKKKFNPGSLRVGQKISVTLARHETIGDKAAVQELAIKLPNLNTVELQRMHDGGFAVNAKEFTSTEKTARGYGKVRTSLLQAAADGGIPMSAMQEVLKAFSYDIDFQREIHPGDTIEVLMDRKPGKSGGYTSNGATVRYAALTLRGKKHEIFRYKNSFGELAWFDGKGSSIKKSLLRTPVDAVNITSGFGLRTHPIMGYTKMHRGVDFGASSGTPIMAAGDGVVTFKGWKSGYGNFITIKHNDKYTTAYGHCSRFAKLVVGSKVKQGQVIAYVGMTGMATGPHLHYEVLENNAQVNPVSKQFNMAAALGGKQLAAFKAAKTAAMAELARLASPSRTTNQASAQ